MVFTAPTETLTAAERRFVQEVAVLMRLSFAELLVVERLRPSVSA
jgi:hypothetical protein